MKFGATLKRSTYPPWRDQYIDYDKLKQLLKETSSEPDSPAGPRDEEKWTEDDESSFVEELVNVQLEKVHKFHADTVKALRQRTEKCEAKLDPLAVEVASEEQSHGGESSLSNSSRISKEDKRKALEEVEKELDSISKETNELEKYSRINFTGFIKAAKKHDRKRGSEYRVRPLLQVRLSALPFNQEDYSPLLYRLSTMYSFIRQQQDGPGPRDSFPEQQQTSRELYTSHKFWVHPDNLLELKTIILRRLPVLVYNPQSSKVADGSRKDPAITSIYFDNPAFSLYTDKVDHKANAGSVRLRWYGNLSRNPEILIEKKVINEDDTSAEERFPIKEKYILPFLHSEYHMEKQIRKQRDKYGLDSTRPDDFRKSVNDIQEYIEKNSLQPVLRANYTRTAFQIPGDERVRISLDTNLVFIREDAIDTDRPCRDPHDWHRTDIDDFGMQYPFKAIRKGEISRFPHALLEIKIRGKKKYAWVDELMNSHLVYSTPRFSKFVQGVAALFEDNVNTFPFWASAVETDIRRDPQQAFEEEQERKLKASEDEFAVGSLLRTRSSPAFKPGTVSPVGSPNFGSARNKGTMSQRLTAEDTRRASVAARSSGKEFSSLSAAVDSDDDDIQGSSGRPRVGRQGRSYIKQIRSILPAGRSGTSMMNRLLEPDHRLRRNSMSSLPSGVSEPRDWIKNQGPVKVEGKVWLANERTYIKWLHVATLLGVLSLGLYNAAGKHNKIAEILGLVYGIFAVFTGFWGYGVYMWRRKLILGRSGRDFDAPFGPVVVCIGLAMALVLNFAFKYVAVVAEERRHAWEEFNAWEGPGCFSNKYYSICVCADH